MKARKFPSPIDASEQAAAPEPSHAVAAVCSEALEAVMSKQQKAYRRRLGKGARIQLGSAILAARLMGRRAA